MFCVFCFPGDHIGLQKAIFICSVETGQRMNFNWDLQIEENQQQLEPQIPP
jgi:hypothetical protein